MKIPSLRNVALTAPYFHNGDSRTLAEVVQFYNRGGNATGNDLDRVPRLIRPLGLDEVEQARLVSFLESLTDERVWRHQAPFDHPELTVPEGHLLRNGQPVPDASGVQATTRMKTWAAVGAGGYADEQLPLPFLGGTLPQRERVWIRSVNGQRCLTLSRTGAASWSACTRSLDSQVFSIVHPGPSTRSGKTSRATQHQLRVAATGQWVTAPSWQIFSGLRTNLDLSAVASKDASFTVQELAGGGMRLVWLEHQACLTKVSDFSARFMACSDTEGAQLENQRVMVVSAAQ